MVVQFWGICQAGEIPQCANESSLSRQKHWISQETTCQKKCFLAGLLNMCLYLYMHFVHGLHYELCTVTNRLANLNGE